MRCQLQNPDQDTHGPAVAQVTCVPSENRVRICRDCLDWWFDAADEDETNEPSAVLFYRLVPA